MTKPLFDTDWEAELRDDEQRVVSDNGDEISVVLLAGLQRLARKEAGLICQSCQILTPSNSLVQAIFTVTFSSERGSVTFVGTADCSAKNTSQKFQAYATAVAESRAEARALRKALGIRRLSSEEIGMREGIATLEVTPNKKADGSLIKAIETLIEDLGIDVIKVLDAVIEDKDRRNSIFELSDFTVAEAQKTMAWLNDQEPEEKSVSTKDKRTARKEELKKKLNKD